MSFPKIEGYVVTEKLGSGSYSTVYKAYTKVGARSVVAVKCVDKCKVKQSGTAVDNLITEIRLLKTLAHPHIVQMKEFTWDDKNIYIIMEYCCGGDLSKYIHRYGRVPEMQVLYFLQQLASALKFLREKGVVHMDLKPHNLLLHKGSDGKYILKVADFGFAQHLSLEGARSVRGSPLYMAPEMLAGRYDARVDLWSVGVIMYECLFGRAPYSSATLRELVDKIQRKAPIEIPRNSSVSAGCVQLLTRLLQHDPDTRISYEEFFAHEYLDLDHMPSRENYDKAVGLIKQAIELDAGGQLRAALQAYSAALQLLVPAARVQTDALRKEALTAKLTRYMERAEEIKQYLKYCEDGVPPAAAHRPTRGNAASDGTQELPQAPSECGPSNSKSADGTASGAYTCGTDGQTAARNGSEPTVSEHEPRAARGGTDSKRRGLRRLLSRAASHSPPAGGRDVPPLQGESALPVAADANDICRIT
ncbi:serine/threonine-protein kinase ULK3 [Galleria mellonella]|uniref:Serine/threonine-protein kinase ULK3 n=1 Tax=Galleria mellonella TaxID=7137 RepID=A0ABM3MAG2_GALME|nr:serine/threonine-protein kinase ULK3 [Galleria mellonella]